MHLVVIYGPPDVGKPTMACIRREAFAAAARAEQRAHDKLTDSAVLSAPHLLLDMTRRPPVQVAARRAAHFALPCLGAIGSGRGDTSWRGSPTGLRPTK